MDLKEEMDDMFANGSYVDLLWSWVRLRLKWSVVLVDHCGCSSVRVKLMNAEWWNLTVGAALGMREVDGRC